MTDTYVESMVKVRAGGFLSFLKYVAIALTVIIGLLSFMGLGIIGIIIAVVFGVLAYFLDLNSSIEYEYLYCDK